MKIKLAIILTITFFSSTVFAAGDSSGYVTRTLVHDQGFYTFFVGVHNNKPSCASTAHDAWAIDIKTPGGKGMLAILMLAYSTGKTVVITGTGTCDNIWGERENARAVELD
jgi:hypothetical protein